jgi:transposase
MVKKDKRIDSKGNTRTQIRVVEGYRLGVGMPTKQRTIRDFGCLEDQVDQAVFMEMVQKFNEDYKNQNAPLRIKASTTTKMYSEENRRYNYGYKYFEAVYDNLHIDEFIDKFLKNNKFRGEYEPAKIFKFLVLLRLLSPDSKRASFQMKDCFYGIDTNFNLPEVYRALENISDFEVELQRHLNEKIKETIGRDMSFAFYDVTNYFCEIDFPDGEDDLRKRGVSKEHRVDPIIAMGLFMDGNGLPVSMSIFPGNTSDSITLQPTMKDIKASYGLGRLVVVADKGMNSSNNINAIINAGDGFLFSQILKGKKGQRYHTILFDEGGWISNENDTYRYKLFEEEYKGKDAEGKSVNRTRKVLIYWNKSDADIAKRKRDEKLEKAARSVKNNVYSIKKGVDEYTKENIIDKESGEVLENTIKRRSIDIEKAKQDSLFDGYFCIITSELDYDERKMRQVYGGLWKIEQSFRIMKSDLYTRPIFVSKNSHIKAHFLICFVALLIMRIIQCHLKEKVLSAERITRTLYNATCHIYKGGVVHLLDVGGAVAFKKRLDKKGNLVDTLEHTNEDEIALDYKVIQELFGTDFYNVYQRQEVFNKSLKSISLGEGKSQ